MLGDYQLAARIGVHLPYRNTPEMEAAEQVVDKFAIRYGGSTHSILEAEETSFIGNWLDTKTAEEYKARVCLLMIDVLGAKIARASDLDIGLILHKMVLIKVDHIRTFATVAYSLKKADQKSIWITVTPLIVSHKAYSPD